jgi:glycosyltransferase involved in cell wall biosynthesis
MKKFHISVVITTYNRRRVLERAIISVLKQTNPADEIVLIDDGSSDGTSQLVTEKYPMIRYFWQKNSGISFARNQGLKHATGDWIAFLDSDDEWLPHKLENQINALNAQPEYKVCHTNEIWFRKGKRVNPMKKHAKFGGRIFDKCLPLCVISPSSVIIHRSVFENYGQFDESLTVCEDYDLWLRICAFLPILYIQKPQIIKYGGHRDQLSRKFWGMDRFRIISLEKIINNPALSPENRISAVRMILKKIDIYIMGAEKRNKTEEVKKFTEKKAEYSNFMSNTFSENGITVSKAANSTNSE